MNYFSTNRKAPMVSLKEAVLNGLAPDGGLYMPEHIPTMSSDFFAKLSKMSFQEIAFEVGRVLFDGEIDDATLQKIGNQSFDFPVPLVPLDDATFVLELFGGPTLAFKDFAARFMARLIGHAIADSNTELTILVATSGDTGSAVAHGFYNVPGIRVCILYPSRRVSDLQEKQLTTMGGTITALEIQGTFDDCQKLVKQALVDPDVTRVLRLGSANSINIARLFPQTFYYFFAVGQLLNRGLPIVVSVPSGNVGNLSAGLIAKQMGLPVHRFIAATNANSILPEYLAAGEYVPRPSLATLSNAMDVGNPSNFVRMLELYHHSVQEMREAVCGYSVSEEKTKAMMREVYEKYGYVLDPHGAVGCAALAQYRAEHSEERNIGIFLETAHPAKFKESVDEILGEDIQIPPRLQAYAAKEKHSILLSKDYAPFKSFLVNSAIGGQLG